jgi:hypothetical protein
VIWAFPALGYDLGLDVGAADVNGAGLGLTLLATVIVLVLTLPFLIAWAARVASRNFVDRNPTLAARAPAMYRTVAVSLGALLVVCLALALGPASGRLWVLLAVAVGFEIAIGIAIGRARRRARTQHGQGRDG